jgi:SAM-dependent methyltransferase
MLALARRNVAAASLGDRLLVARADAKATGYPSGSFDMIVSNSLAHHIPAPLDLFAEVARLARPGAGIFIKDLHRADTDAEHRHLVERYASDCTLRQRQLFSDSLRAALTVKEVAAMCAEAGLSNVSVRRCSDRHWCVERRATAES